MNIPPSEDAMNRIPTLDITEGVARLTLNRPPLNILTLAMIRRLAEGLDTVAQRTRLKAMVLAATSARFGQPEIKLGVFPPIAAALFPQLIGYQQAARLLFSGETIAAREAAQLGLVTYVATDDELEKTLERLLTQFRGMSAAALRMTKRALLYGADLGVTRALPRIADLYLQDLMATADAHEGVLSFIEKRQPVWSDA